MAQKQNRVEPKASGFIAKPLSLSAVSEDTPHRAPRKKTQASPKSEVSGQSHSISSITYIFQPFIHNGSMQLSSDISDSMPIEILRDTGASQSLLLSDTLVFSEKLSTGTSV